MSLLKNTGLKFLRLGAAVGICGCVYLAFARSGVAQTAPQVGNQPAPASPQADIRPAYFFLPAPAWHDLLAAEPLAPSAPTELSPFFSALVHTTDMALLSPPSPDPAGLVYLTASHTLLVSDCEVDETVNGITHFLGSNLWELALDGGLARTANISPIEPTVVPMSDEPTGVAWNPGNGHYYFSDDNTLQIYDLDPGQDGLVGTEDDAWTSFSTQPAGSADPEGVTYDSWHDRLFVVDGANQEVYQFTLQGELVGQFDVAIHSLADPEGIDFNPASGTLFVLGSSSGPVIIETTIDGNLRQRINVSASAARAASGLAYAPASDGSGARHFYMVDRGVDNNADPEIVDGKMYEMTAPETLNKLLPLDAAASQPLSLSLSWTPNPEAAEYQYCFDTSDDNACSHWVSTGASTSVVLSDLAPATTYFWQVRALDSFGATYADGADTAYWAFTTGLQPGAFSKDNPPDGATGVALNPTLSWSTSSDAIEYQYCLDTSSNDHCDTGWVSTGTNTSIGLSELAAGTTYYWQVRALNSYGITYADGSPTAFWSFRTSSPPGEFTKLDPSDGANGQPLSLTLAWGASSDATSYEYCVDSSNNNTCSGWTSTGSATSVGLSDLSTGTTYYWQVRAINATGTTYANGAATAFWSFSTGSQPGEFNKISPPNGVADVSTNPSLSWEASSAADRYEYCYDTTNDNHCSNWIDNGTSTSASLSGLAWGSTYYWQVRAVNDFGVTFANGSSEYFYRFSTLFRLTYLPFVVR